MTMQQCTCCHRETERVDPNSAFAAGSRVQQSALNACVRLVLYLGFVLQHDTKLLQT